MRAAIETRIAAMKICREEILNETDNNLISVAKIDRDIKIYKKLLRREKRRARTRRLWK